MSDKRGMKLTGECCKRKKESGDKTHNQARPFPISNNYSKNKEI